MNFCCHYTGVLTPLSFIPTLVFVGLSFNCTFEPDIEASNEPKFESSNTWAYVVIATVVPLCVSNISSLWKLLLDECVNCAVNLKVLKALLLKLYIAWLAPAESSDVSTEVSSGSNAVAFECETTSIIFPACKAESNTIWVPLPAV